MVSVKNLVVGVICAGIGIIVFLYFFQSEERKVEKRFEQLSEWVSKKSEMRQVEQLQRIRKIKGVLAEDCVLIAEAYDISEEYSPQEFASLALSVLSRFSTLSLVFYDLQVDLSEEGIAGAAVTAKVKGRMSTGEVLDETHELECVLEKDDDEWLFARFEVVEVLEK